ncbi:MAG: hypothetical protein M3Z29_07765 [Pseudomonadota bacterium]|nr:hypothetical protein [Pseudomonadota bacterium]
MARGPATPAEALAGSLDPAMQAGVLLDIELPFRSRLLDDPDAEAPDPEALPPGPPLPFLVELLLQAKAGRFGLEVEIKADDRVVGTWDLEVSPQDERGAHVSRVKATLYLCGSARADPRATGAFLVLHQWWVNVLNKAQRDQLYGAVAAAVIERLNALLEGVPNEIGESRSCVLYLIDGRSSERRPLSLERLQSEFLQALDGENGLVGMKLHISHGRGASGRSVTATMPSPLQAAPAAARPASNGSTALDASDEPFVPETVSPANMRWQRRASDKPFEL